MITKYFAEPHTTKPGLAKLTLRETAKLYIVVEREPVFGATSAYVHRRLNKDGKRLDGARLYDTMEQALDYLHYTAAQQLINIRQQAAIMAETVADLSKAWSAAREKGI